MASVKKRGDSFEIVVSKGFDPETKKRIRYTMTWTPDKTKSIRQNEAALNKAVAEFESKIKDKTIRGEKTTFKDFATKWLAEFGESDLEATTRVRYRDDLVNQLFPRIGAMPLSEIDKEKVNEILKDIRKTGYVRNGVHHEYSDETIKTVRRTLSSVMSAAVEKSFIRTSPCIRQRKQKREIKEEEVKSFSKDEAILFLEVLEREIPIFNNARTVTRNGKPVEIKAHVNRMWKVHPRYRTLFIVTVFSGCRRGELLALTWECVDFENSTIRIRQAAAYTSETGAYIKTPKSAAGYREIILPDVCMSALKELKREMQRDIMRFGTAWEGSRKIDENFVFATETGRMMSNNTPRRELNRVLKAYNKAFPENPLPVLTFHQLRHTNASLLISQGLDPVAVAKRLGHANATTTLKIYAHSFKERDRAAADALEGILTRQRKQA